MSVRTMLRRQGTRATVYRPTGYTQQADATSAPTGYTAVATDVPLILENLSVEGVEKVFGAASVAETLAYADPETAIARNDRLVITAGPHLGRAFRVEEPNLRRMGSAAIDHDQLGLVSTTETIP